MTDVNFIQRDAKCFGKALLGAGAGLVVLLEVLLEDVVLLLGAVRRRLVSGVGSMRQRADLQTWLHIGGARGLCRRTRRLCAGEVRLGRGRSLHGSIAAVWKGLHGRWVDELARRLQARR